MARPKKNPDVETKNLNARIPKDLAKKLKVFCVQNDITIQDFLIVAIREKLKGKK